MLLLFTVQSVASAIFTAYSTAFLLSTGSTPGRPRHTGSTCVLGSEPNFVEHPQKSFELVRGWAWTSRPITASYFIFDPFSSFYNQIFRSLRFLRMTY